MKTGQNKITGELFGLNESLNRWEPISAAQYTAANLSTTQAVLASAGQTLKGMFGGIDEADRPALNALGETRPGAHLTGSLLPHLAAAPLSGGLMANAAISAGMSALDTEAGGTPTERASLGLLGGAVGDLVGRGLGAGSRALMRKSTKALPTDEMAQQAIDLGASVTPGMRTMNQSVQVQDRMLMTSMAGKRIHKVLSDNADLVNRTAADAIGVPPSAGGRVTKKVLERAESRLAGEYDHVFNAVGTIDIPSPEDFKGLIKPSYMKMVEGGQLTGIEIRQVRTALSKFAKGTNDEPLMGQALELIADIDDQLAENLSPADLMRFDKARDQWRALFAVEKGAALSKGGDVNYASMSNALNRSYGKRGYTNQNVKKLHQLTDSLAEITPSRGSLTPEGIKDIPSTLIQRMQANRYMDEKWLPTIGLLDEVTPSRAGSGLLSGGLREVGRGAGRLAGPSASQGLLEETNY